MGAWEVLENIEFSDQDKIQILRTWKYDIILENSSKRKTPITSQDEVILSEIKRALNKLGAISETNRDLFHDK